MRYACKLIKKNNHWYACHKGQDIPIAHNLKLDEKHNYYVLGKIKILPFGKRFYVDSLLSDKEISYLLDPPFVVS